MICSNTFLIRVIIAYHVMVQYIQNLILISLDVSSALMFLEAASHGVSDSTLLLMSDFYWYSISHNINGQTHPATTN